VHMPRRLLVPTFVLLFASACDTLTAPKTRLDQFDWVAIDNPDIITEGMDAAGFYGDVNLLGQLKSPTLCFALEADFSQHDSLLELHVTARPSSSSNCSQSPGGFRYTGVIRAVGAGTYTVRVTHSVPGTADQTFEKEVVVR